MYSKQYYLLVANKFICHLHIQSLSIYLPRDIWLYIFPQRARFCTYRLYMCPMLGSPGWLFIFIVVAILFFFSFFLSFSFFVFCVVAMVVLYVICFFHFFFLELKANSIEWSSAMKKWYHTKYGQNKAKNKKKIQVCQST